MSTPLTGRRRQRNNNNRNEPPALRHRAAGGRVTVRRVANNNNNLMAGINQYGTMMPQRLVYGNNNANNNWKKPGAPRTIRALPYITRKELTNEVSLHNFKNGNVGYLMFRGKIPVLYTAESLTGMIRSGPHRKHLNTVNNLNHFLAHVKNNSVLFRNAGRFGNRTARNIRKVRLTVKPPLNRNSAARVIQRKFRGTRR